VQHHRSEVLGGTILVTGGAGFIGSAVVRHLLAQGNASVVNVDKLTYAANLNSIPQASASPRYQFAQVDICNGREIRRLFEAHQPDALLNLAAESHVDRSIDDPGAFIQTNVVGTFTLLQESLRYWRGLDGARRDRFRFLHVSTDEVYGTLPAEGLFSEASPYAPNSPYSASKAGSDHLVRAWHETYGLPSMVTNCSNNYGPYQFPEKLIPLMIIRGLEGQPLPVYGDGMNIRDWLHVDDHVRALLTVLARGRPGETYNVGARSERTNLTLVHAICDLLDQHVPSANGRSRRDLIAFVSDRPGHDRRYAIDPTKIERELGWTPRESFESGLASTVHWYLDNRGWWRDILQGGYRTDRIGVAAE
jgi:dTDP-glucose 4,6-dehydratase